MFISHVKYVGTAKVIRNYIEYRFSVLQCRKMKTNINQKTNGPVNAHLISWPTKAQNVQNLENIW